MSTQEKSHLSPDHTRAKLNAKPARDAAHELYDGIISLVAHYLSKERSRAVREGLARRRERLRQAAEKETK
jgi:hypothetical protein